jgi:hypothetical protein
MEGGATAECRISSPLLALPPAGFVVFVQVTLPCPASTDLCVKLSCLNQPDPTTWLLDSLFSKYLPVLAGYQVPC